MPGITDSETNAICIALAPFGRPISASCATYTNEDVIDGTVHTKPGLKPRSLTIAFTGRTSVKVAPRNRRGHNGTTKVTLFREQLSFRRSGRESVPNGGITIPFSFRVPSKAQLWPKADYSEHPSFRNTPHHDIPASYEYYGSLGHQVVEYYIEAALTTSESPFPDMETRQYITFRPSAVYPPSYTPATFMPWVPHKIWCHTYRLLPDNNTTKPSMRMLLFHITKHDLQGPAALFQIGTKIPSSVYANAPLPITLSLEHLRRSASLHEPPPIYLRRAEVMLFEKLRVRLPGKQRIAKSEMVDEEHDRERPLLDIRFASPGKLLHNGMDLNLLGDSKIRVVPSFKTYALALTYRVGVKLWIECAGEKYAIPAQNGDIEILPQSRQFSNVDDTVIEGDDGIDEERSLVDLYTRSLTPPPPYE